MMRKYVPWCVLPLVAGCVGPVPRVSHRPVPGVPVTEDAVPRSRVPDAPMTVEQAVSWALAENVSLEPYRAGMRVALAEKDAARDVRDPQLRFAYGESDRTEEAGLGPEEDKRRRYRGVLRLYAPNPWVRNAVANAGDARMQLAAANLRAAEYEVAAQIHEQFHDIRRRRTEREILQRIADVRRDQLERTEERLSGGVDTASAVVLARIDCLDAKMGWKEALRDEHRALADLAAFLGFEDGRGLEPVFPPAPPSAGAPADEDLEELTERAFERRSDLAAVEWRAEVARWDVSAARRASVPWFAHIQGAYLEERNGVDEDTWSVQAAVDLPVFSLTGSHVGIAAAELEQFQAEAGRARAQVRSEVRQSLGRLRLARDELERFERETTPVLDQLNASLASDVGTSLRPADRADLQEAILKAEQLRLDAALAYELAWLELQIATGSDWLVRPTGTDPPPTP